MVHQRHLDIAEVLVNHLGAGGETPYLSAAVGFEQPSWSAPSLGARPPPPREDYESQSRLGNAWWTDSIGMSMLSAKYSRFSCLMGQTPCERFGMPFDGPTSTVTSFRAMVEYHPISAKDYRDCNNLFPKGLPGIYLGYTFYAGESGKGT